MWYAPCNRTNRMKRKMHGEWNEKCTVNDVACNSTFICYHMTDNPPIKWQGSAWVLYNITYFERGFPSHGLDEFFTQKHFNLRSETIHAWIDSQISEGWCPFGNATARDVVPAVTLLNVDGFDVLSHKTFIVIFLINLPINQRHVDKNQSITLCFVLLRK